jgi:hypothetical protein
LVHLAVAGLLLLSHDANPQWFIHFGRTSRATPLGRQVLGNDVVVPNVDGHDGREFWVLARDPLLVHAATDRRHLDRPAYRAQRIAYPMLAAPWRVAGERALVWGLLVTNLAAITIGAYFAARLAAASSAPLRASLSYSLNPALFTALALDVADALALATLMWGLVCVADARGRRAAMVATLAALTKEPTLLAFAAVAALHPGISRRDRVRLVIMPLAAVATWGLYAHARLGFARSGAQEFAAPFYGYWFAFRHGWQPVGNWGDAVAAAFVLAVGVTVVVRWWDRRSLLLTAALPFALLTPFLSAQVVDLADSSLRAIAPAVTLLVIDLYAQRAEPGPATVDLGPERVGST